MFIEKDDYPFTICLEDNWKAIRDEFINLPVQSFDPWVQQSMHGKGWSVFGLYASGEPIAKACDQCPKTAEILKSIEGLSIAGFSRMAPRTHIKPHIGWAASVYRLHLGLVVPLNCKLRVADETRHWAEGECWIFDDTVEHEAWNDSDSDRGILLLDFLRPGHDSFADDTIPSEVQDYVKRLETKV